MKTINRRELLQRAGAGVLGLAGWSVSPLITPDLLWSADPPTPFEPDVDIHLEAVHRQVSLLSGPSTDVWSYRGKVLNGPAEALDLTDNGYLGPTLHLKKGQKVRIRFFNRLPEATIIHWHGMHVPDLMDGHPRLAIRPGGSYLYEFEVLNRAGTYWYHPHPHGRTGHQVYGGLAGLLIVSDKEESALPLPAGRFDLPLVIQDRTFDSSNQLIYLPGGMMDRMTGMQGNRILVNGRPDAAMEVAAGAYRLRILNGSNARIYRLAWDDGTPLTVIGTDGGMLAAPVQQKDVLLAPAERIEVWADFGRSPAGTDIRLVSLPLPETALGPMMGRGMMGRGMMGGMMRRNALPEDSRFTVMRFTVGNNKAPRPPFPDKLVPMERLTSADADNPSFSRRFTLAMSHMRGTLNGRVFAMQDVAWDEIVHLDTAEIWEFANTTGGMGMMNMPMPHPMHIHAVQFQVLDRHGARHDGFMDRCWKDTVLVMPGERVRVIARFAPFAGLYLYHCHNLEHEDGGMMRNFQIV